MHMNSADSDSVIKREKDPQRMPGRERERDREKTKKNDNTNGKLLKLRMRIEFVNGINSNSSPI